MKKQLLSVGAIGAVGLLAVGCGSAGGGSGTNKPMNLTIVSQESEEATIDDYIVKDLIQAKYPNVKVTVKKTTAGSSLAHQELTTNSAQVYVGYDGTEFTGPLKQSYTGSWKSDPTKVLSYVQQQEMKQWNIWVSPSLGFEDTYALAVTDKTQQKYGLKTDGDVAKYASKWTVATDNTFQQRQGDGYTDFANLYGLKFKKAVPMDYDLMYSALAKGNVNAAVVYSTDGRLESLHLATLTDTKHFFPPYHGIVLATQKAEQADHLSTVLKPLYGKLTTKDMTDLNYQVVVQKKDEATVAHDWLVKKGLLK